MNEKIEQWITNHVPLVRAWLVGLEEKYREVQVAPEHLDETECEDVWQLMLHLKPVADRVRKYKEGG